MAKTTSKTRRTKNEEDFEMEPLQQQPILSSIKVNLKCKTEKQKTLCKLIESKDVTIAAGPAGTGKTYVACAEALRLLIAPTSTFKKIVIVKSVTVLEGEDIGYLKGNMKEKMEPFMNSFMDNFYKIIGKENSVALLASEIIEILPLAYIRGRSIDEAIIIIDESQNMPKHHLKSTVTRIGEKSKMIFLADEDQVDLKNKKDSGLTWFLDVTADLDEFGTMRFTKDDVVRNPLISKFLKHIEEKESTQNSI